MHYIKRMCIAEVTEFMSTSQPAMERELDFHPKSFAGIFSTIRLKALLFRPSEMMGTPRYFPKSLVQSMPSSLFAVVALASLV